MIQKISEIIIVGGGTSISEGIVLGLKEKLTNKFVLVCNYAYKHFPHQILCCVDKDFYHSTNLEKNPNIYEELKQEKLIITTASIPKQFLLPNTVCVKGTGTYNETPLEKGFYCPTLCGIFALSLAQFLLEYKGIIYLLGFDWPKRTLESLSVTERTQRTITADIHYYKKEIKHRGSGFVGFYERHNPNHYFKYFTNPNIKIYNVSPNSTIENFEKIDYQKFFPLLSSTYFAISSNQILGLFR